MIVLKPLPLEQTSLTFTAEVTLLELDVEDPDYVMSIQSKVKSVIKQSVRIPSMLSRMSMMGKKTISISPKMISKKFSSTWQKATARTFSFVQDGTRAKELFCKVAGLLYERFKKEDVIDARRKAALVDSIPYAPPLTVDERKIIAESLTIIDELTEAKRVAGTANDSVEKFLHYLPDGGGAWGKSVADMDVSAIALFTELWVINTYAKKAESKDSIREVWTNLDGSRSQQYTRSFSISGAFHDRLFEAWQTWEKLIDKDGRETFVIAISPIEKYNGTHHKIAVDKNMVKATSRGVYVIKQVTENTCEWTRAQQFDLNITG